MSAGYPKKKAEPEYEGNKASVRCIKPGDATNFPTDGATVRVHYVGKLRSGEEFDSSRARGIPLEFKLGTGMVIRGWDEAIPQMSKGMIAEITCPPSVAYGVRGYPPIIPPNSTLIFEVELLGFFHPQ